MLFQRKIECARVIVQKDLGLPSPPPDDHPRVLKEARYGRFLATRAQVAASLIRRAGGARAGCEPLASCPTEA